MNVIDLPPEKRSVARFLIPALLACLLGGCGEPAAENAATSEDRIDTAAPTAPTAPESIQLFQLSPLEQRWHLVSRLPDLQKACRMPTQAAFRGGFDGVDLWKLRCADSGDWLVTFAPDTEPKAESCTEHPDDCADLPSRTLR